MRCRLIRRGGMIGSGGLWSCKNLILFRTPHIHPLWMSHGGIRFTVYIDTISFEFDPTLRVNYVLATIYIRQTSFRCIYLLYLCLSLIPMSFWALFAFNAVCFQEIECASLDCCIGNSEFVEKGDNRGKSAQ